MSGLKVVMVAGLVQSLARLRGWRRRRRVIVTLAVIAVYLVLSGAGAAAVRSSMMVSAGLVLSRDGRRPHSFAMLGLCAAVLVAFNPAEVVDVGFQLSFLGTAGILVLAGPIASHLPGPRPLVEPFAVTVAAQLATAPVTAASFGVLSLVGPVANAVALPLLPLALFGGGAGSLLGVALPGIGTAVGWLPLQLAAVAVSTILAIAQGAAGLPLASVGIALWPVAWTLAGAVAAAAATGAWWVATRHRALPATALLAATTTAILGGGSVGVAAAATTPAALTVTVLDVGNGVAVLVTAPRGGTVLVDGGSSAPALLSALGRVMSPLGRHLDAVVLTATDRASAAAVPGLLGHYDVGALVFSQPLPSVLEATAAAMAGTGTTVRALGARPWAVDGLTVRCVASGPTVTAPCVVQLTDGHATALVTGNLAQAAQDELSGVEGHALHAELLVGPTTTAPDPALLAAVRPGIIAVPALRIPPGLRNLDVPVNVTGRDSDLVYDALPGGGFVEAGS